jgi:hypothetical protein
MDDWKKVVQWAAREHAEEKQREREHFKRTLRAWPMIAVAVIPFGWLEGRETRQEAAGWFAVGSGLRWAAG